MANVGIGNTTNVYGLRSRHLQASAFGLLRYRVPDRLGLIRSNGNNPPLEIRSGRFNDHRRRIAKIAQKDHVTALLLQHE